MTLTGNLFVCHIHILFFGKFDLCAVSGDRLQVYCFRQLSGAFA